MAEARVVVRGLAFAIAFVLSVICPRAFSQDFAPYRFPEWPKVSIHDITKRVHEPYGNGSPGSVTQDYKRKTSVEGCPQYRDGVLIGWSMTCKEVQLDPR